MSPVAVLALRMNAPSFGFMVALLRMVLATIGETSANYKANLLHNGSWTAFIGSIRRRDSNPIAFWVKSPDQIGKPIAFNTQRARQKLKLSAIERDVILNDGSRANKI